MLRVVKRKATGFFKSEDTPIIRQAVSDVHRIIGAASSLVRAFYIQQSNNGNANTLVVDKQLVGFACSVVQGVQNAPLRGTKPEHAEKKELYTKLRELWVDLVGPDCNTTSDLSLSHILAYSIDNLLTAYENNINVHFHKYLRKYILCHQLSNHPELDTKDGRKQIVKMAACVIDVLMYGGKSTVPEVQQHTKCYEHLVPDIVSRKHPKPRCYDMKADPWPYLQKMVRINMSLENDFPSVHPKHRKLYQPLPFHSTMIPGHIRLDTSGLAQLLMTKDRIASFKQLYELQNMGTTLNMTTKGDMLSSFEKLFGRPSVSAKEEGEYATELWKFVTNLESCRQASELYRRDKKTNVQWMFDNAVVTDGVSISFQIIKDDAFGRKQLFGPRKPKAVEEKEQDLVTLEQRKKMQDQFDDKKTIGGDPGKHDIIFLTDGVKCLRYTKGQRDQDTFAKQRQKASLRFRKNVVVAETEELNKYSKKSCTYDVFKQYLSIKTEMSKDLAKVYSQPFFRQSKFTHYAKQSSSEMKFFAKVHQTFNPIIPKHALCPKGQRPECKKHGSDCKKHVCCQQSKDMTNNRQKVGSGLEIAYGDWGKHPNALKGCAPTPGIGFRRRCSRFFPTFSVPEHGTSKTCPCCKQENLKNPSLKSITRHHLLRCTNEACLSRWWNRNVAGSLNILARAISRLVELHNGETKASISGTKPRRAGAKAVVPLP